MGHDILINQSDVARLRILADRVAEIAAHPIQRQKAELWYAHNDLLTSEPLVFCDPENGWHEIIRDEHLLCTGDIARAWEFHLLREIHHAEVFHDDYVVDGTFCVPIAHTRTGWGVKIQHIGEGKGHAYTVKPAIEDYEEDFPSLRFPKIVVDEIQSAHLLETAQEVFSDRLNVQQRMQWWWSMGLTRDYIDLRGLEAFMCDMLLEPDWVHRMMDFLCQGTLDMLDDLEARGLLYQNTGNHYVGSGGFGFTHDLPTVLGRPTTTKDMWGFVESQETVSVSPEMYGEFVFPYHMRIAERFGLNCYGCCEPYDNRWKYARQIPSLRRVSCSPWSDREQTHINLGKKYIASIKLNPSPLSRPNMDEEFVREELAAAMRYGRELVPELIMKDCHTLGNTPENAARWVEIAREEIAKA